MNQTYINAVRLSRVLKAAFPNTLPKFGERIEVEGTEYCISQVSAHPRSPLPWDLPPKVAWPIWRQQQAQRQQNRRVPGASQTPNLAFQCQASHSTGIFSIIWACHSCLKRAS